MSKKTKELDGFLAIYSKKNERNEDKNLDSIESVKVSMRKRLTSDSLRYKKYYNIDVNDFSHYDFYLDTTNLSREQVFSKVYEAVKKQLDKAKN